MRPPNYQQARKQKEQRRKVRQAEKLERRTARLKEAGEGSTPESAAADPVQEAPAK